MQRWLEYIFVNYSVSLHAPTPDFVLSESHFQCSYEAQVGLFVYVSCMDGGCNIVGTDASVVHLSEIRAAGDRCDIRLFQHAVDIAVVVGYSRYFIFSGQSPSVNAGHAALGDVCLDSRLQLVCRIA